MNDIDKIFLKVKEEGDSYEFTYRGMECIMERNYSLSWCGYVKLPIDCYIDFSYLSVHGGVTYDDIQDDYRLIGFDCSHSDDISPKMVEYNIGLPFNLNPTYKDKEYVICELKGMVDQIKKNSDFIKVSRASIIKGIIK